MNKNDLLQIAFEIGEDRLILSDIPFSDILSYITEKYGEYQGDNSTLFEKMYSSLLMEGLRVKNKAIIVNTLLLLANNTSIINVLQNDIISCNEQIDFWWDKSCTNLVNASCCKNQQIINEWHHNHTTEDRNWFDGKGIIYSVITGDYDDLSDPEYIDEDLDYILFTNNRKITSKFWEIVYIDDMNEFSDVSLARYIKTIGHPRLYECDYTVYVDGKVKITNSVIDFIRSFSRRESMICFPHPSWSDLKSEGKQIIELGKAPDSKINAQLDCYYSDGYKDERALIESCVLIRSNRDERLKTVMQHWWNEMNAHTFRDQISLPYVCWKDDYVYDLCPLRIYNNKWFEVKEHK